MKAQAWGCSRAWCDANGGCTVLARSTTTRLVTCSGAWGGLRGKQVCRGTHERERGQTLGTSHIEKIQQQRRLAGRRVSTWFATRIVGACGRRSNRSKVTHSGMRHGKATTAHGGVQPGGSGQRRRRKPARSAAQRRSGGTRTFPEQARVEEEGRRTKVVKLTPAYTNKALVGPSSNTCSPRRRVQKDKKTEGLGKRAATAPWPGVRHTR